MASFKISILVWALLASVALVYEQAQAQGRRMPQSDQLETRSVSPPPIRGQSVGRQAAARYLAAQNAEGAGEGPDSSAAGSGPVFSLGLGSFLNSRAYQWSSKTSEDSIGRMVYGFAYKYADWGQFDFSLKVQFHEYFVQNKKISKLSFQPSLSLPQIRYRFPVYFGAGLGGGLFFDQPQGESPVSLDYKLFLGLRVVELFDRTGFFIEWALENHLHVFSDGQMVGQTLMAGFTFSL